MRFQTLKAGVFALMQPTTQVKRGDLTLYGVRGLLGM